jgi:hypothetical protein
MSRSGRAHTGLGSSLIFGLTNVRTGIWWDSGIEDGARMGEPGPTISQRFSRWLMRRLRAYSCLFAEFTGRFAGPYRRYWYLSDGEPGDGLGIYELVRRRVPLIICSDATRDGDGGLAALANTIRRVRVDLQAEIHFLSSAELAKLLSDAGSASDIPQSVRDALGILDQLPPSASSHSMRHAALAKVTYPENSSPSVLLYVKASVTGDEPVDLLEYQRQHPRFPHQSVRDQSLSEAQWESYRQLGHHCTLPLFSGGIGWMVAARQLLASSTSTSSRQA